jgi:hypothetical protein
MMMMMTMMGSGFKVYLHRHHHHYQVFHQTKLGYKFVCQGAKNCYKTELSAESAMNLFCMGDYS